MYEEKINAVNEIINPNQNNLTVHKIIDRNSGFTQIDNRVLRGKIGKLSACAKLALITFLSFHNGWDFNIDHFNKTCGLSKGKSRKARRELISKGFLEVESRTVKGRIGYRYTVYELPKDIMFKNPKSEIGQQKTESEIQATETGLIINKDNKEIITNKDYKKDSINTCFTEGKAIDTSNSFKLVKRNSSDIIEQNSKDHVSNIDSSFSNKKQINMSNDTLDSLSKDTIKTGGVRLKEFMERLNEAETRLDATERRKKKRQENEAAVIEYIKQCSEIDDSIKDDLVRFVKMRSEKGIRTTITTFCQLYEDLIAQCPTLATQKERIKYAISCSYPTFNKKSGSNKKGFKFIKQPDFVIVEDECEGAVVEDFEL